MPNVFLDQKGDKDDWNGGQERERSGERAVSVDRFVLGFVNHHEESDFHSK